jgi:RNase P/RNase MRP subunit POP5
MVMVIVHNDNSYLKQANEATILRREHKHKRVNLEILGSSGASR